ncbi:hypothetical protein DFH07DRAFT_842554 [Mycena maculata]|uniref:F-box domain-containing protein n=1 Tax=Mycena maculata TaxID=230809 RepID=A0AAD7I991_9AGAR|nr:hypothetical protein DFH07DRAFT_842554 [Mycena maculata]
MSPTTIPELLQEIATHLDNPVDLSRFSQCDRFIHGAVAPLLFQDINAASRSLPKLAKRFSENPEFAQQCRSLVIHGPQLGTDRLIDQPDVINGYDVDSMPSPEALSQSVTSIVREISQHGRLERFSWHTFTSRRYGRKTFLIEAGLWTALSSTGVHLHELDLTIGKPDRDGIALLITASNFCNLKIFRLRVLEAFISPHFQTFLDRLNLLEHLDLDVSPDIRTLIPGSLTFASTHTHLRFLTLTLLPLGLPPDLDFLARHPRIESLKLVSDQSFHCDDSSLPNLKALCVNESTVVGCPAIVSTTARRNIKHLCLIEMPLFDMRMIPDIVQGMASSLTCLEIDFVPIGDFRYWIRDFSRLLSLAPNLLEFGMIASPSIVPLEPTFNAKDLTDVLAVLDEATHLQALRFFDISKSGSALPESFLANLGSVPASLRYIKWDVHPDPKIYCLETVDQCTMAVAMARPPVVKDKVDWTSESVLDHLSWFINARVY